MSPVDQVLVPAPSSARPPPNALETLVREHLAVGPMSVATYIRLALAHPVHGYYRTRDPLGADGDFLTAPEASQMFGELIGLWGAHVWGLLGQPSPIRLVEFGPGRGTLMADALRACRGVARSFAERLDVDLIETSPVLRATQRERLVRSDGSGPPIAWHDGLSTVPRGPMIVIANEFFDALPVHQLVRAADGWRERQIGVDQSGALIFTVAPAPSPLAGLLDPRVAAAPIGSIAEVAPAARRVVRDIARRLAADGGVALFIDYGHAVPAPGDTLQAVRRHQPHPVLERPGEADVTAHVDFAALAETATQAGVQAHGPIEQGLFLRRLGIVERATRLIEAAAADSQGDATAARLSRGLERLVAPDRMGNLFKVMALGPVGLDPLPGFVP